jgi:hypothetical protein
MPHTIAQWFSTCYLHCQPCVWEEWSKKIEKETLLNNALPSPSWHLVWHLGELLNPDVSIPS